MIIADTQPPARIAAANSCAAATAALRAAITARAAARTPRAVALAAACILWVICWAAFAAFFVLAAACCAPLTPFPPCLMLLAALDLSSAVDFRPLIVFFPAEPADVPFRALPVADCSATDDWFLIRAASRRSLIFWPANRVTFRLPSYAVCVPSLVAAAAPDSI